MSFCGGALTLTAAGNTLSLRSGSSCGIPAAVGTFRPKRHPLRRIFPLLLALLVLLVPTPAVSAAVPRLLHYQGRLTDPAGNPQQGIHQFTFKLYRTATGAGCVISPAATCTTAR